MQNPLKALAVEPRTEVSFLRIQDRHWMKTSKQVCHQALMIIVLTVYYGDEMSLLSAALLHMALAFLTFRRNLAETRDGSGQSQCRVRRAFRARHLGLSSPWGAATFSQEQKVTPGAKISRRSHHEFSLHCRSSPKITAGSAKDRNS